MSWKNSTNRYGPTPVSGTAPCSGGVIASSDSPVSTSIRRPPATSTRSTTRTSASCRHCAVVAEPSANSALRRHSQSLHRPPPIPRPPPPRALPALRRGRRVLRDLRVAQALAVDPPPLLHPRRPRPHRPPARHVD